MFFILKQDFMSFETITSVKLQCLISFDNNFVLSYIICYIDGIAMTKRIANYKQLVLTCFK